MAGLKPGIDTLEFAFPDLDGTVQRFPAPRHAGKVVIDMKRIFLVPVVGTDHP